MHCVLMHNLSASNLLTFSFSGDGQYEYRGHKYTHLQKEDYQKFSDWYSAHGSELDQMSTRYYIDVY